MTMIPNKNHVNQPTNGHIQRNAEHPDSKDEVTAPKLKIIKEGSLPQSSPTEEKFGKDGCGY